MKSFLLAALVILAGTFILNSSAAPKQDIEFDPVKHVMEGQAKREAQKRQTPDLPTRAEVSQLDIRSVGFAESVKSDIDRLQKQVADLPDEIAAVHSRFNALANRQDAFDQRLETLEAKCESCSTATASSNVEAKVQSQADMLTRLLGRIEQLESKGNYQNVGFSVGNGSSGGSTGKIIQQSSYSTSYSTGASNQHWTYPGDLSSHLASSHGVNAQGMSHEGQLALHDSIHESTRNSTSSQPRPQTKSSTQTSGASTCPAGTVCPNNASVDYQEPTRRGWLGRFKK